MPGLTACPATKDPPDRRATPANLELKVDREKTENQDRMELMDFPVHRVPTVYQAKKAILAICFPVGRNRVIRAKKATAAKRVCPAATVNPANAVSTEPPAYPDNRAGKANVV